MPVERIQIKQPCLLVVEGKEEGLFFEAFNRHLGLQKIQVLPIGGKERLSETLKALVNSPGFSGKVVSLGIIRDADTDPQAAFQSVCNALCAAGLPIPTRPLLSTPSDERPKVGVMILPAENESGMLEDLCLRAVAETPAMRCVTRYFECLRQQGLAEPRNLSKAKTQVFLASRSEAGLRLGEAAQKGFWPWDAPAFDPLKSFLQQIAC